MNEQEQALFDYQTMLKIRKFEDRSAQLYGETKIRGFLHLYNGEEAIATGAIPLLTPSDSVVSTYRDHGHALVRGISPKEIMAELFGKEEGCSHGRGGSMHLFSKKLNFYGGNAIVGGGLPLAAGIALSEKLRGTKNIVFCFFGDGAVAEGIFHETLNLASLWKLPIVFICENNLYAMGTGIARELSVTDLSFKSKSYGIDYLSDDGMNVGAVRSTALKALNQARNGSGPVFVEFSTYRFRAHSMYDPELYRNKEEIAEWKKKDPIPMLAKELILKKWADETALKNIEQEIEKEVEDAVAFAETGTLEDFERSLNDVYQKKLNP